MGAASISLVGEVYGLLTVVSPAGTAANREQLWNCACACGQQKVVRSYNLRTGKTRSCGCLRSRGGISKHALYPTWKAMIRRCHSPDHPQYAEYGGRGIHVCQQWRDDPQSFFDAVGERPSGHTLDRIDNSRGYEPDNVRWATPREQSRNQRRPPNAASRARLREQVEDLRVGAERALALLDSWEEV